jgi:hypothetical protein
MKTPVDPFRKLLSVWMSRAHPENNVSVLHLYPNPNTDFMPSARRSILLKIDVFAEKKQLSSLPNTQGE